ncbi:rod shape-determining protein MreC [Sphingopyxis terrae subsp. ummariensis]|jgi:rod shape-determining protein MreC|uniref:rod shape-determining protein MreC n=1 Tax=uncultured Sphingopyxis sp. TaxID=310581 RepID=UPI000AF2CF52|nr:rod shape-determining protein MreC [uncultured Sphingopyxis sp.]KAB2853602.1 MAG: rod shape-determining protein MreC [Sphingopyxis terrae]
MVRPAHRRPGQSRKAQYSLFAAYVIAITGALAGLLLAILSVADPVGFAALRVASQEITAPIARGTRSVIGSISGVDDTVSAYVGAGSQNRRLRKELAEARRRLVATSALEEENRQLKSLLGLQQTDRSALAHGYLLTSTSTSSRRIALLSLGRNRGVSAGQPVRGADGLIGRVLTAGPSVSQVLLLTDVENVVPVRRARDGLPALATGRGNGDLDVRTLNIANNPFKPGDILVTSGTGGLYPPNIPVAIVVRRQDDGALARPLADPAKVDAVAVLRPYTPDNIEAQAVPAQSSTAAGAP